MLNGIAPVLIFTIKNNSKALSPVFNALESVPLIGKDIAGVVAGIPIPLYLDERITGLYVENEARNIDIETKPEQRFDDKSPYFYQRALNSSVSVNIIASKSSLLLSVLLAIMDMIVPKIVSRNYSISYFNGSTLILNGLLQGFNTVTGNDDDLVRITLQIQKEHSTPDITSQILGKVTGAIPGLS